MAGGFLARLFFPLDREGKNRSMLRSNYTFLSLGKISVFYRYFLSQGIYRSYTDIFSARERENKPSFSLSLRPLFFARFAVFNPKTAVLFQSVSYGFNANTHILRKVGYIGSAILGTVAKCAFKTLGTLLCLIFG